ncbi:MAG: hypothetical protein KDK38_16530, partial [Leptospiraceae bacterium]|nr:hypothetical protein [Leptospiraceae bacterium]
MREPLWSYILQKFSTFGFRLTFSTNNRIPVPGTSQVEKPPFNFIPVSNTKSKRWKFAGTTAFYEPRMGSIRMTQPDKPETDIIFHLEKEQDPQIAFRFEGLTQIYGFGAA